MNTTPAITVTQRDTPAVPKHRATCTACGKGSTFQAAGCTPEDTVRRLLNEGWHAGCRAGEA